MDGKWSKLVYSCTVILKFEIDRHTERKENWIDRETGRHNKQKKESEKNQKYRMWKKKRERNIKIFINKGTRISRKRRKKIKETERGAKMEKEERRVDRMKPKCKL